MPPAKPRKKKTAKPVEPRGLTARQVGAGNPPAVVRALAEPLPNQTEPDL